MRLYTLIVFGPSRAWCGVSCARYLSLQLQREDVGQRVDWSESPVAASGCVNGSNLLSVDASNLLMRYQPNADRIQTGDSSGRGRRLTCEPAPQNDHIGRLTVIVGVAPVLVLPLDLGELGSQLPFREAHRRSLRELGREQCQAADFCLLLERPAACLTVRASLSCRASPGTKAATLIFASARRSSSHLFLTSCSTFQR
jgi:hypothetical protein